MSNVNFKPNEDRILVESAPAEEKTASGIIIPDTAKEKPIRGRKPRPARTGGAR